jgi:Sigma-70 factor, region 1.2
MIIARESATDKSVAAIDGLMRHLFDISKYPMKDYLAEVDKHPVLTEEEEQTLAEQVFDDGDEVALEKLVLSNLRLVANMALDCCDDLLDGFFDPADDAITALYRWASGTLAPAKALTYRLALPAVAGA